MTLPTVPLRFETGFSEDRRGVFGKPFTLHSSLGDSYSIREIFWTSSSAGVVRGMHFQVPPTPIGKLVWVSQGSILDVAVDLRDHDGFGSVETFPLDGRTGASVWIPAGFAHGFQALEDNTIVNYAVDGDFDPATDAGVRWDSIGFEWPLPVGAMSDRDRALPALADFSTPFRMPS